jgi:hypothetical protein
MLQNECRHNQLGGCKNGGWDDVSLNEVSVNIVFEISYPLAFKTLEQMILYDVSRPWWGGGGWVGDVLLGEVGSGL